MYDYIIIGGGIAGIYCAYKLSSKYKILLLEKEKYLGGRVLQKHWHGFDLKLGAGIASKENKILYPLIKKLKIPHANFVSKMTFINSTNSEGEGDDTFNQAKFTNQIKNKVKEYKKNGKSYTNLSVLEFLKVNFSDDDITNYLKRCSYLDFINSDVDYYINLYPIEDNIYDEEKIIGLNWYDLVEAMVKQIKKNNGKIITNFQVNTIDKTNDYYVIDNNIGKKLIFALTLKPLTQILKQNLLSKINYNHYIGSVPFVRIYTYHKNGHNFNSKFIKTYNILDNNYLQKVLVISDKILMASYSDSFYADYWKKMYDKHDKNELIKIVEKNLKKIIPETSNIDDLLFHYWDEGVHYFKPLGTNNFKDIKKMLMNPVHNIYVVGEIISRRQGWVEGALSSVDDLIDFFIKQ